MMLKAGVAIELLNVGCIKVVKELILTNDVKACYIQVKLH